jgi:hypothetical protein
MFHLDVPMSKMLPCLLSVALCVYLFWYFKVPISVAVSPFVDTANYLMDALGGKLTK